MYAELLARSNFSLLEGASDPEQLVATAAQRGISHLGLVDRDAVYGLVRAFKGSRDSEVTLVSGATLTLTDRPPVTVLVETLQGWAKLCCLLSESRGLDVGSTDGGARAHRRLEKGRGELPVERLLHHRAGLTVVLHHGWRPEQAAAVRDAFPGRTEVLLTRRLSPTDRARTQWATGLAKTLGLPLLASNEPLFHDADAKPLADVLTCIRRRTPIHQAGRSLSANAERHLLPEAVFRGRFSDHPQAVRRGLVVADRCTFRLDELHYSYPPEVVPQGRTPMQHLAQLTRDGLAWRYPAGVPAKVRQQVLHELAIIQQLDFPAYFLTVYDIVRFARSQRILCQGRGSAANSAVCFALGITSVDPATSSLLFERFISAERGEPPDIDVDFEHERREEVIQYIYAKYGRDRAALVNEVITYRLRSAIRDVGKVFGLSLDQVDRLAKSTDRWSAGEGAQVGELVTEAGLDPDSRSVRLTLQYADQLRGAPRHLSQHVGGFVIAAGPLIELCPVEPASMPGRTVIQWDKYDIDVLRFVKVDVLALGMLTAIRKSFEMLDDFYGVALDLATVPKEDPRVYDMFCAADTVGVFQIESRAQMSMLPRLKPRCFYDLVIEVSIVRPGPIQGGMVHPYLRRRSGLEEVTYPHPLLEPILERTLGVPIFQEQVMQMASAVGGFSPGQADELRRAMGAWRKTGNLDGIGRDLVKGMVDKGIPEPYAQKIFQQILGFGEYGFPESHAASFALLVYVSGWLKCHYPGAFGAALINSQPMGFYSPRAIVEDMKRHDVEVRPVCVLNSGWDCDIEPGLRQDSAVRLGFRLIRGFSQVDADRIVHARADSEFRDLPDFAKRTGLDRGKLQSLADANAFANMGIERRKAAWVLQGLWTGLPLFAGLARNEPEPGLPVERPIDTVRADFRAVGLSVHTHPMELLRDGLSADGICRLAELAELPTGTRVRIAGLVQSRQRPGTAKGVVFMTLEDETAMTNLILWPQTWQKHRRVARGSDVLGAEGKLQRQDGAVSVLVDTVWRLDRDPEVAVRSRNFR